jgi:hypothetical protein
VLLGDADVEEPLGEPCLERQQPGWAGHRGRDRDDAGVGVGLFDDRLGERLRVTRRDRRRRTDGRIEDRCVVQVLLVVVLRGQVAPAFLGDDVHEDRSVGRQLERVVEGALQLLDVVAVERTDVAHTEGLEERRRLQEFTDSGLERVDALLGLRAHVGKFAEELLQFALPLHVHRIQTDVGEAVREPIGDARREAGMIGHRPVERSGRGREVGDRRGIAAAVVVENDDHALLRMPDVVEGLVRQAARHRSIADDGHDVAPRVGAGVAGDGHSVGVRQDRRGVAVLHEVVGALLPTGVPRQPTGLAQLIEPRLASGDDLVDVRLVAGVPKDRVVGRIEHTVQRQRQLDRAEIGPEMSTGFGDGLNHEVTDLAGQFIEVGIAQSP